jgi:hypothetical protein
VAWLRLMVGWRWKNEGGRATDGRFSLLWSRDGPSPNEANKQDQDTNTAAAAATTTSNKSPSLWIDGVSYAEGIAGW